MVIILMVMIDENTGKYYLSIIAGDKERRRRNLTGR